MLELREVHGPTRSRSLWSACLVIGLALPIIARAQDEGQELAEPAQEATEQEQTEQERPRGGRPSLGIFAGPSPQGEGVQVVEVLPNSPAEQAGIQVGDIIIRVGDQEVATPNELSELLERRQLGEQAEIVLRRNGEEEQVNVTLQAPERRARGQQRPEGAAAQDGPADNQAWLGIGLPNTKQADAVVVAVFPNSPAFGAGLQPGDVIVAFDDQDVATTEQLIERIRQTPPNRPVELRVKRGDEEVPLTVQLASRRQAMGFGPQQRFYGPGVPGARQDGNGQPAPPGHEALMEEHRRMMEGHRHMAEQHQRVEQALQQLLNEVRMLRQEVEQLKGQRGGAETR